MRSRLALRDGQRADSRQVCADALAKGGAIDPMPTTQGFNRLSRLAIGSGGDNAMIIFAQYRHDTPGIKGGIAVKGHSHINVDPPDARMLIKTGNLLLRDFAH